jgi:hypothetical protein
MTEDIEKRFQLLITTSLFFPVFLASLGTSIGQPAGKTSLALIQASAVFGLNLVAYIAFQIRKDELADESLKWIKRLVLVALGVFIVPILGIVTLTVNPPIWIALPAVWLSERSVWLILGAPPFIELIILFSPANKK